MDEMVNGIVRIMVDDGWMDGWIIHLSEERTILWLAAAAWLFFSLFFLGCVVTAF
jgi:hypothetical protein